MLFSPGLAIREFQAFGFSTRETGIRLAMLCRHLLAGFLLLLHRMDMDSPWYISFISSIFIRICYYFIKQIVKLAFRTPPLPSMLSLKSTQTTLWSLISRTKGMITLLQVGTLSSILHHLLVTTRRPINQQTLLPLLPQRCLTLKVH